MKSKILMLCMLFTALGIAGCAMLPGYNNMDAERCPETGFLKHTDRINFDNENYELDVIMHDLTGGCDYTDEHLVLNVNLNFAAAWTPRGMDAPKRVKIPYFATVIDEQEEILSKTEFAAVLSMSDNKGAASENVTLHLPREKAGRHRVIFGFSVTPAQYHHNQLRDLKTDAE